MPDSSTICASNAPAGDPDEPGSQAAAYKIDVGTMTTDGVFTGLQDPYTYSDMTGNALGSVACTPEG